MSNNIPQLPSGIDLPTPPSSGSDMVKWAGAFSRAINHLYRSLSSRLNDSLLQGTDTTKPAANGSQRFYWATDTQTLYYDDGTWRVVGGSATSEVHLYAPGSFTIPTGNFVVMSNFLQLTGTQLLTVQGTGRLRIT